MKYEFFYLFNYIFFIAEKTPPITINCFHWIQEGIRETNRTNYIDFLQVHYR